MLSSAMGKEQDLFHFIKTEDVQALGRLLSKYKATRHKLLGATKRLNVDVQDTDGMAGLHQAALMGNVPIMQMLLDSMAVVDIKDNNGMRPLHYAAWQGKMEPVALLLQHNSSVNEPANEGETPLHLACQHGHVDVTSHLLRHHANPTVRNKDHKTSLDLACEFGRHKVVEILLQCARCRPLLMEAPQDSADNDRTTCLHLAARNGHLDVIRSLLRAGVEINRSTLRGTALHEAAMCGKLDVVKLLIESGIDVNKPNSYDQTALDIVKSYTRCHANREMKQLLKEIINAVQARAIKDYHDPSNPDALPLNEGDIVTVLEQRADGLWRGIIFRPHHTSLTGYFPATAVQLLDRPVGGMQRTGTLKKVAPPVVPDLAHRHSGGSFSSGYGSQTTADRSSCGSLGAVDDVFTPHSPAKDIVDCGRLTLPRGQPLNVPSPVRRDRLFAFPEPVQMHYTQVVVHPRPNSQPSTPTENLNPLMSFHQAPLHHRCPGVVQMTMEDQGIDVSHSPGRESPGGSSGGSSTSGVSSSSSSSSSSCSAGSRHSSSSLDSGRVSTAGSDGKVYQHRLSVHSYESGFSQRQSYHSSSSSLGSVDRTDEGITPSPSVVNVKEMMMHGLPDIEVLTNWLTSLQFEDYIALFVQAGYDMPTISRMTPEDLTAIGITKPIHRRKLKAEIAKLNISDGIPNYKPASLLEWLRLLRLEDYHNKLCEQGCDTVDQVTQLTWEDLEDIGIQKLGHQKKIMLAIKRVQDINSGIRRPSQVPELQSHNIDMLGRGGPPLPHPTSLGVSHHAPPYQYYSQEVAINTTHTKASPTMETGGMLEFKTFQQSPPKDECLLSASGDLPSPTHMGSFFQPNTMAVQVRYPYRGHSLESLDMEDSVSVVTHHAYHGAADSWYDTVSAWRQHGYDTDSELSIHSGDGYVVYEGDGTATLHRPKGMVKPRPVAKIVAKSRRPDVDAGNVGGYVLDRDPKAVLKASERTMDGSPRHHAQSQSSVGALTLYGTLKSKRTPPPPPKRTNSIRGDPVADGPDPMQDKAFATCVKSLTSRFNMATREDGLPPLPPPPDHGQVPSPAPSEEFPPPPSPLPSALEVCGIREESADSKMIDSLGCSPSEILSNSAKDTTQLDELHANPLFRQRRKDSADSSVSTSSTESNSLPFANENVGTIKQKIAKPHGSTTSPVSTLRKGSLPTNFGVQSGLPAWKRRESMGVEPPTGNEQPCGTAEKVKPGAPSDVIDDIEHMLANLSNQLDAMLESEMNG